MLLFEIFVYLKYISFFKDSYLSPFFETSVVLLYIFVIIILIFQEEDLKHTVEESARLQRAFEKYFDLVLLNSNFDKTYEQLKEAIEALSTEPQWVPISWVY